MMGLGVCCRLRNEAWAQPMLRNETKTLGLSARPGKTDDPSDAMTLAVAHEQRQSRSLESGKLWVYPRFCRLVFPVAERGRGAE